MKETKTQVKVTNNNNNNNKNNNQKYGRDLAVSSLES